ncbi:MAG: OmpA family protein [Pseudomonadota bacterium]
MLGLTACETTSELPPPPPSEGAVTMTEAQDNCTPETLDIYFGVGETGLNDLSRAALNAYAERYVGCDFSAIEIQGHADAQGSAEINEQVSLERAQTVRQALVETDIDFDRIVLVPFGERDAINEDGEIVPMNRKTVVSILY